MSARRVGLYVVALASWALAGCVVPPEPAPSETRSEALALPQPKPPIIYLPAKPRVITKTKTIEKPVERVIVRTNCAAQHLIVPTIEDERGMSESLRDQIRQTNQSIAQGCPVK